MASEWDGMSETLVDGESTIPSMVHAAMEEEFPPTPPAIRHSRERYAWNRQAIEDQTVRVDQLQETIDTHETLIQVLHNEIDLLRSTLRDAAREAVAWPSSSNDDTDLYTATPRRCERRLNDLESSPEIALPNIIELEHGHEHEPSNIAPPHVIQLEHQLESHLEHQFDSQLQQNDLSKEDMLGGEENLAVGDCSAAMGDEVENQLGDVGLQTLEELLASETASISASVSILEADEKSTTRDVAESEEDRLAVGRALIAAASFTELKCPMVVNTGFAIHDENVDKGVHKTDAAISQEEIGRRLSGNYTGISRPQDEPHYNSIWRSEEDKGLAIMNHKRLAGRADLLYPNIFKHGVKYEPCFAEANTFRSVLITNIPRELDLRDVLFKVRGGEILKAVKTNTQFLRNNENMPFNSALVTFLRQGEARAYVDFVREHGLFFPYTFEDGKVEMWAAEVKIIETPTYPSTSAITNIVKKGLSRHITIDNIAAGFNLGSLLCDLSGQNNIRRESILDMYWTTMTVTHPTRNAPHLEIIQSKFSMQSQDVMSVDKEESDLAIDASTITDKPSAVHEVSIIEPQLITATQNDSILHIELSSIDMAGSCYGVLANFREYKNLVVNFVADPCAGPLQQILQPVYRRENLLKTDCTAFKSLNLLVPKAPTEPFTDTAVREITSFDDDKPAGGMSLANEVKESVNGPIADIHQDSARNNIQQSVSQGSKPRFGGDGFRKSAVFPAGSIFMTITKKRDDMLVDLEEDFDHKFGADSAIHDLMGLSIGCSSHRTSSGSAIHDLIGLHIGCSDDMASGGSAIYDLAGLSFGISDDVAIEDWHVKDTLNPECLGLRFSGLKVTSSGDTSAQRVTMEEATKVKNLDEINLDLSELV